MSSSENNTFHPQIFCGNYVTFTIIYEHSFVSVYGKLFECQSIYFRIRCWHTESLPLQGRYRLRIFSEQSSPKIYSAFSTLLRKLTLPRGHSFFAALRLLKICEPLQYRKMRCEAL